MVRAILLSFGLYALAIGDAAALCEQANFTAREAATNLAQLNAALMRKNQKLIIRLGGQLEANLPCMKTPAPPQVFAVSYRYIGLSHYYRGDEKTAARWWKSSLELSPTFEWGINELSTLDPASRLFEQQRDLINDEFETIDSDQQARNEKMRSPETIEVESIVLRPPEGTVVYVDGRKWNQTQMTDGRPHIVFIASKEDRHIISRFLVDGDRMPSLVLGELTPKEVRKKKKQLVKKAKAAQKRREKAGSTDNSVDQMFQVETVKRQWPKEKTPLLVSGGLTILTASGMYGYTYVTNAQFYAATTTTDQESIRQLNNGLIIASGVIGAIGASVTYTGILLDSSSMPSLRLPGTLPSINRWQLPAISALDDEVQDESSLR